MATARPWFLPPKRRILFIQKAFQLRFIAKVTAVIVMGTALTGGLLYLFADQEFGRAFFSAHYQARSSWELLLPAVLAASFLAMCLVAVVAVVLTLYDSHKIGGPLYRFQLNLRSIAEGDLTLVTRLRASDELQPLTEAMNELTRSLRDKVQQVQAADEELRLHLGEARGVLDGGGVLGEAQLGALEAAQGRLRAALAGFRT